MNKSIYLLFFLILTASCKTTNQVTYFQDIDELISESSVEMISHYDTKIVPDDLLAITVSSIDPNAVAIFNLPLTSYLAAGQEQVSVTPVMQSYLVDSNGYIDFPVLSKIEVAGLTRSELTDLLKEKISQYVKSPIVTIKIVNFKISVIGEVQRPGAISIPGERISILDAISLAGDLTIYGERKNVLLIRDENGKRLTHRFDLTSSATLTSPYYYLRQNDIVYVEPNDARKGNSRYSQNNQFNVSVASTIISAISILASLGIALWVK